MPLEWIIISEKSKTDRYKPARSISDAKSVKISSNIDLETTTLTAKEVTVNLFQHI